MSTSSPSPEPPPEPAARRSRVGRLKAILGLAGTAGLLGLLLARADLAEVAAVFRRVDPLWLAIGLALYVVLQCVRALRYRGLAPEASGRVLVGVHFVHALLLRVMPFRTGELGFAWLMRRYGGGGFTRNLVGVLLLRVLDLTTIVAVFAVGLLALGGADARIANVRPGVVVLGAGLVAAMAPLYVRGLFHVAHRVLSAVLSVTGLTRVGRVRRAQESLAEAVRWSSRLPRPLLWRLSGLTTLQWAVNFVLFGVLMAAMKIDVSVTQTLVGGTGSVLGGLLPLAGIGNFGPLEAGWSVGFEAAGVPRDLAIASAFGFSAISFAYALVTGAAGWLVLAPLRERD